MVKSIETLGYHMYNSRTIEAIQYRIYMGNDIYDYFNNNTQ